MFKITVNGEPRSATGADTVLSLLETLGLKPEATVVQRNDDVLERDRYATTRINEGDAYELVRFVGGG